MGEIKQRNADAEKQLTFNDDEKERKKESGLNPVLTLTIKNVFTSKLSCFISFPLNQKIFSTYNMCTLNKNDNEPTLDFKLPI